jgi:hypothetical protein
MVLAISPQRKKLNGLQPSTPEGGHRAVSDGGLEASPDKNHLGNLQPDRPIFMV